MKTVRFTSPVSKIYTAPEKGQFNLPAESIPRMFFETCYRNLDKITIKLMEKPAGKLQYEIVQVPQGKYLQWVIAGALGLQKLGVKKGDRVAIFSRTRFEWCGTDLAILCNGAISVTIYPTTTATQIEYFLNDSGSKGVCVDTIENLEKVLTVKDQLPDLEFIICFDPIPDRYRGQSPKIYHSSQVLVLGSKFLEEIDGHRFEDLFDRQGVADSHRLLNIINNSNHPFTQRALSVKGEDLATIVYTAGTTGVPKGAMLTHKNLIADIYSSYIALQDRIGEEVTLTYLPFSHIFARTVEYVGQIFKGATLCFALGYETIQEHFKDFRPTMMLGVPHVFEKIHQRVLDTIEADYSPKIKKIIEKAIARGKVIWRLREQKKRVPLKNRILNKLEDAFIFKKIRSEFGGHLKGFISGSAALHPEIMEFFRAIGLEILEGYGLAETSPVTHVNRSRKSRVGTVGPPIPMCECRIAEDGEILIRGPMVMQAYWNKPRETAEAIDPDGWFHTGDIGECDEEGYLRITGRKKVLLVLTTGKKVSPELVEGKIIATTRFIDFIILLGDNRKYVGGLVVPNFVNLESKLKELDIPLPGQPITRDDLEGESVVPPDEMIRRKAICAAPRIQKFMEQHIQDVCRNFSDFEIPKKVCLIPEPFSERNGLVTPTRKLKRSAIIKRYADIIESMFED